MRRVTSAVVTLLLGLGFVGCATIPSGGPVETGLTDLEQVEQFYQFTAPGPAADASQEDLVRGFILAATSSADDYGVAREFLTPDYARQWDPHYGVLIDDGSRPYESDGEYAGIISLSATAKVDVSGTLLPTQPKPKTDLRFEFERVGDQWRIASAPNGIILDSSTFMAIWSPHQLYFVGAGEVLVPETRWFVARAALATEIVGALLDGPGERLRDSVHSGFPSGTALATNSVPVVDGEARIDMTAELLEAGPEAFAEVQQQLKLSLQNVPGVNGFALLAEGSAVRDLEAAAAPKPVTAAEDPTVVAQGVLGSISTGDVKAIDGIGEAVGGLKPEAVTLAADDTWAVVRGDGGTSAVNEQGIVQVDARSGQIDPSIDLFDYVWTATADGAFQTWRADGTTAAIAVPWLADRTPVAMAVSPDGARLGVLVKGEFGSQLLVAGILRDADGAPVGTTNEADTQLWAEGDPIDFDWVGSSRFAVLTKAGGARTVVAGGPGMFSAPQGSVPGGEHLAGAGARTQLRVLAADGDLFAPQGSGWQRVATDVDVLAKHG